MASDGITDALVTYAVDFDSATFDDAVSEATKLRLLDTLICGLAGVDEPPVAALGRLGGARSGSPAATMFGSGGPSTPAFAAFHNAAAIRYLDWNDVYDAWVERYDTHAVGHPSGCVAGVLAAAEAHDRTGADLLEAIVLAYEVQCRLTEATVLNEEGFDHVLFAMVGTVLAVGSMLELGAERLADAVGIAVAGHVPLRQTRVGRLSAWKGLAVGNAIRNGMLAVELAAEGIDGPRGVFTGKHGLASQFDGSFDLDLSRFGRADGDFAIRHTHLKPMPICYHITGAIDCVAAIAEHEELPVDDIASITVETYDRAIDVTADSPDKWDPRTRDTADHSMPYCLARWLDRGTLTPADFTDERVLDPDIRPLMRRISVVPNEERTTDSHQEQRVRVRVAGEELTATVAYPTGHARNPMTMEDVRQKCRVALGDDDEERWRPLRETVDALDGHPSVDALVDLLS